MDEVRRAPDLLTELPGQILDARYRIDRCIGKGGMGTVFVAEHLNLRKRVAIKFLRPQTASGPLSVERFRREAEVMAKVTHPGVVQVHDFGWSELWGTYLVMEYLDGQSLSALLRALGRPMSPAEILPIVYPLLDALSAIHAIGLVHRDIKPANVFLARDVAPSEGVKILDFGIAKMVRGEWQTLTAAGIVMGTARFMASEQARGERDLDLRVDLCAVGRLLYAALLGKPAFSQLSGVDLVRAIGETSPTSLLEVCPGVDPNLAAVVDRANHVDREQRFESARALSVALQDAAELATAAGTLGDAHAQSSEIAAPGPATAISVAPLSHLSLIAGRYEIIEPIGRGGMGVVYRARHRVSRKIVALKLVHIDPALGIGARKRFEQEAQAVSQISHPGLVSVWDAGIDENGRGFLAMELLSGECLRARLRRGPLDHESALRLTIDLVDALRCIHHAGIVHRDLKPENVFLSRDHRLGQQVKILDFGITRVRGSGSESDEVSVGTLAYVAPEQLTRPTEVSPAADMWSMGVMLYEMLAGERPFDAETPAALVAVLLNQPHVPLVERRPEIPVWISELVDRCLEKDPAHRIGDGRALARALEASCETSSAAKEHTLTLGQVPAKRVAETIEASKEIVVAAVPVISSRSRLFSTQRVALGTLGLLAALTSAAFFFASRDERPREMTAERPPADPLPTRHEAPSEVLEDLIGQSQAETPEEKLERAVGILEAGDTAGAELILRTTARDQMASVDVRAWARIHIARAKFAFMERRLSELGVMQDDDVLLGARWAGLSRQVARDTNFHLQFVTGPLIPGTTPEIDGEMLEPLVGVSPSIVQCAWLELGKGQEFVVDALDRLSGTSFHFGTTVSHPRVAEDMIPLVPACLLLARSAYREAVRVSSEGRCHAESVQRERDIESRIAPWRGHDTYMDEHD